jgi:hypothetical protein
MKSLLISLVIVAVLVMLYLRPWVSTKPDAQPDKRTPPADKFMRTCKSVSANQQDPESYCRCLWQRGVRNPSETLLKPAARAAAAACATAER